MSLNLKELLEEDNRRESTVERTDDVIRSFKIKKYDEELIIRNLSRFYSPEDSPLILEILKRLEIYLKYMDSKDVKKIYDDIETSIHKNHDEYKIKFNTFTNPRISGRNYVKIYSLSLNGRNILHEQEIKLYKSSGTSRDLINPIVNIWLPFIGIDQLETRVIKPEDIHLVIISKILENSEITAELKRQLDILLSNANIFLKYKRFMNDIYAICSFLIKDNDTKDIIESKSPLVDETYSKKLSEALRLLASPPIHLKPTGFSTTTPSISQKAIELNFTSELIKRREEKQKAKLNGGYYEKYIKYKNKYMQLKYKN